jgi:hypothetical protein
MSNEESKNYNKRDNNSGSGGAEQPINKGYIGDSKKKIEELRRAAEIPPRPAKPNKK